MPNPLEHQPEAAVALETGPLMEGLLKGERRAQSTEFRDTAKEQVDELIRWIIRDRRFIAEGVLDTIEKIVAEIDRRLSAQVNLIIHHPDLQKLEGTWRGLHHLVFGTETDKDLQIKVVNISKKTLADTLRRYGGVKWDRSPIFDMFYSKAYGILGGNPYGAIIGDFDFDHSAPDLAILGEMGKIASAAHAPFIAAAAPSLFNLESWQTLNVPRDLKSILERSPEHAGWRSLRDSEDAKYIGLCMPRFLSRMPYGAKTNPVDDFDFEEVTEGGNAANFTWSNSAFVMAANITASFKSFAWCTQIQGLEAGGAVSGLPAYTFPTDDGGRDLMCPTEIAITMRRSKELQDCGLLALEHKQNSDVAAFIGCPSVQKPATYEDKEATKSARLSARLAYLFAASRFAHFIEKMVYAKIGSFTSREEMEMWLNKWLDKYVLKVSLDKATEALKAKQPLSAGRVEVTESEDNPGVYDAKFYLVPHFKLEELHVSINLVGKLPTKAK